MTDPLVIDAGELDVEEMMTKIEADHRLIVRTEFLGSEHEVTLRRDEELYYCDTPAHLHKHSSEEEMRHCLRKQGYASDS